MASRVNRRSTTKTAKAQLERRKAYRLTLDRRKNKQKPA